MWGWLEGIFEWLGDRLQPLLTGIVDNLRRFKWFVVALVGAIIAPINWVLDWGVSAASFAKDETLRMFQTVDSMQVENASAWWSALSSGGALMNCVVPLDYAVAMGSLLLSLYIGLGLFRAIIWAYKRLPTIFGWGTN